MSDKQMSLEEMNKRLDAILLACEPGHDEDMSPIEAFRDIAIILKEMTGRLFRYEGIDP